MSLQSYDFSNTTVKRLVQSCYDAANQGVDPNSKAELFAEIEHVAELLENSRNTTSKEQIQEISNTILHEVDNHSVGENYSFAEWIAKSDRAYKPLHHLFQAIAKANGQPKALKPDRLDSSGTVSAMQYIDAVARETRNTGKAALLLDQTTLQNKINEATIYAQNTNYQHLDVFGPKHKNNVMQRDLVETLKLTGIKVPESHGIETDQILKFLNTLAPEIFSAWKELGDLYSKLDKKEAFLKSPDVLELLAFINQKIQTAFERAGDKEAVKLLGLSEKTLTWLSEVNERGSFLMTRSSGAEDARKNANAGGNVSVAYVEPVLNDFLKSIGEVVRSYFSESSLKNRLNADLNPFDEPLKLAVTVQELIGEEVGGSTNPYDIPVSLVLFTNEPLYVGGEEFRVMRISATYGHGEGVVGYEGIATDTILILQSVAHPEKLHIDYDNQYKPERLAPVRNKETGKVELQKIPNSKEMASQPALNKNLIGRLFQWGVIGETFFRDYQDMEIVIKDILLHPVQSRPINRPEMLPTHLDLKKIRALPQSPLSETIMTDMIVPGQASVVEIVAPKEILLAETLKKAEALFETKKNKLVVVRAPEGANTHPVVNFSNMGMPCLNARDGNYDKVQDLVEKVDEEHHLAVCMQAGTVSLLDTRIASIEDCTSKGFVVHPAKIAISLPVKGKVPRKSGVNLEIPQEIKDFLLEIRTATTAEFALKHLNTLKSHGWLGNYSERVADLRTQKQENPLLKRQIKPILAAARSVEAKVNEAFLNVEQVLNLPKEPGRMEFLFKVKILETILLQEHAEGSIGRYSVLNMQESFEAADAIINYQNKLLHPAHFADVLMDGSQGISQGDFEDWSKFLLKLEPLVEKAMHGESTGLTIVIRREMEKFKNTLETLRKTDALPLFMTFFLKEHINRDPVEAIRTINMLMPQSEKALIEQLLNSKKAIQQLRADIATFGDPKLFPAAFNRLQEIMAPFLASQQPWLQKDQWKATSPITRSIALQTMNDLVELYDSSIKSMKSSQEIKDYIDKTKKFKEMLGPYLKLLAGWAEKTVGKEGYPTRRMWPIDRYLQKIESIYTGLSNSDPNQQKSSPEFSVNAAVLGSCTDFERHLPITLEDVFTLIHQNLISSTAVLLNELIPPDNIQNSRLPAILKMAIETSKRIIGKNVQQRGLDITKTGITFHFNVPLDNHSGKFLFHYDKQTGKLTMEAQFLGEARDRWLEGAYRASILDAAGIVPLLPNLKLTKQELIFKWDITDLKHLSPACLEYGNQARISIRGTDENDIISFVREVEKQGILFNAALFVLKENTGTTSSYRAEVINLFLKTMVSAPDDSILELDDFFRLVTTSPNLIYNDLAKAFIAQINGENVDKSVQNVPSQHKLIIERLLELHKNESKFIGLLPTNAVEIWEALLNKNKALPEAMAAIRNGINPKNFQTLIGSINLLVKMIEIDQAELTAEVINFLKVHGVKLTKLLEGLLNVYNVTKVVSGKVSVNITALGNVLFQNRSILGTEQNILMDFLPKWLTYTTGKIDSTSSQDRIKSFKLMANIVDTGHGIHEAIAIAAKGIKDPDLQVRNSALELWKVLRPSLKTSPAMQKALKKTLEDWSYWNLAVPDRVTSYYSDYLASLSKLKSMMER